MKTNQQVLGYLSAAPRVSTRDDAEHGGARSHVLGVMKGFEVLDWEIKTYIVGDQVPERWNRQGSERIIRGGGPKTLFADLLRLALGLVNSRRAWNTIGDYVDWVYERAASLQTLGTIFKHHNIPWILETNAPLFYEAKHERKTVVFSSLARIIEINAYKKCDVLVCVSEVLKEILVQEIGIPSKKIVVIPNGVDVDYFDPALYQSNRLFGAAFTVGFVGKLFGWQGLDILLDVLADLKRQNLIINLVVVGDGVARPGLEKQTQALGLSDQVIFTGRVPRDRVPALIAGFDIGYSGQLQLPIGVMYRSPLKLYEYMAMAKPVLASDFDDARQLVIEGETGFLFEPGNKASLSQKLHLAYQNRGSFPDMGQKARSEVICNHSWESRVAKLIREVDTLLSESR